MSTLLLHIEHGSDDTATMLVKSTKFHEKIETKHIVLLLGTVEFKILLNVPSTCRPLLKYAISVMDFVFVMV